MKYCAKSSNQIKWVYRTSGSRSRPLWWRLPVSQVAISAPPKPILTWDIGSGSKRCQPFTMKPIWMSEWTRVGKGGFWDEWWMNEEMKNYVSQKVKSSILKEQHERRSEWQELFWFLVCREATCQRSEEIFEGYEVEVDQVSKRVVYFSRPWKWW